MITLFLLNVFFGVVQLVLSILPTVSTLPFGMDEVFVTALGYWHSFLDVMWIFELPWELLVWYIYYKIVVALVRIVIGNRIG